MKKLLLLCLFAAITAVSANADVVYEPLEVVSGFNRDVIAEAMPVCEHAVSYLYGAGSTTHNCYYSMATTSVVNTVNRAKVTSGYLTETDYTMASVTGWPDDPTNDPANRIIRCIEDAKDNPTFANVIWQLAPYDEPNALALRPDTDDEDEEEGLFNQGKGTLKFKKVGCYQKLYFLIVSPKIGTGCTQDSNERGVYAQVFYTDGEPSEIIYFNSIGLSGQNGARVCKTNIYEDVYKKNTKKDSGTAYACAYEFNIDHTRLIDRIEFENKKACTGSVILAVTGMTADIEVPSEEASVTSNIEQNSFEACWEAIADAASYRLDVATDIDFQHILEDYNNKVIAGEQTCQEVADLVANNDYYWRVRSVNSEGGQSASSAPRRVRTAAHAGASVPATRENDDDIETDLASWLNTDMASIDIHRTLYRDGYFNTICLPFDLNAAGIDASPLAGCDLFEYVSATQNGTRLDIVMQQTDHLDAGVPYLIRWANNGDIIPSPLTFNGVRIKRSTGLTIGAPNDIRFVGHIGQFQIAFNDQNNLFLGENNVLYWPDETDSKMKGFRAYFAIPPTTPSGMPIRRGTPARIVYQWENTTSIDTIRHTEDDSTGIKRLENGQLVIIRNGVKYDTLGKRL